MNKVWTALAPMMMIAAAAPAAAAPQDFVKCDGYAAPGKKTDGLVKGAWLFGLVTTTSDFRRADTDFGAAGIAACEAALADPLLQPAFWLRRAHLLQARAFHQIAAGKFDDGLKSLEESDGLGRANGDRFFGESVAQGNQALRAIALHALSRNDEAKAALEQVAKARPYAASLLALSDNVRLHIDAEPTTQVELLKRAAPIEPERIHQLFWLSMFNDDFAGALSYAPQIGFDLPRGRGNWTVEGEEFRKYQLIKLRANFAGAVAYALLATGKSEDATAAMAAARDDVKDAVAPPPTPSGGGKISRRLREDYGRRVVAGGEATEALDVWDASMRLRRDAAGKSLLQLLPLVQQAKDVPVMRDVLRQAKPAGPEEEAAHKKILDDIEVRKDAMRRTAAQMSFGDLVRLLPRPEVAAMAPRMEREGGEFLKSSLNGYAVRKDKEGGTFTVRFGSAHGSSALVEEAALLAAAQHVKSLGQDGFFIDSRQLIQRTVRQYGYMNIGYADLPSGYEVRLRIRPAATPARPDQPQGADWRLMSADRIIAALGGKYPSRAR